MWNHPDGLLFSATDLVNFLGCQHNSALDLQYLANPTAVFAADPMAELLSRKGIEHERAYLETLRRDGRTIAELDENAALEERVARTREAMRAGIEVIYQGALLRPPWHGYADFLERVERPSCLGPWSYEVLDTKLARGAKPDYAIQLGIYSALIGSEQGIAPERMHLKLGDGTRVSLRVSDFIHYQHVAAQRLVGFTGAAPVTAAQPCDHCGFCRWRGHCEAGWEAADHLSLVANITRAQMRKLQAAGVTTVHDLARLETAAAAFAIQPQTFDRLRAQARLQSVKRNAGEDRLELLSEASAKGFARLPLPDLGDIFFDMEGVPLYDLGGGLEYLFGFVTCEGREIRFTAFWAHDRAEEKHVFEVAVDFIVARLAAHPGAHVYHYASYEPTALKRLMMFHGTREVEIDNLLREHKLVDLYKVVREALRVSEPSYSLKNIERFYTAERQGEVTAASDSIVVYESWRELRDPALLQQIVDYNAADCRSTLLCRDWLVGLRPRHIPWFTGASAEQVNPEADQRRRDAEQRASDYAAWLLDGVVSEKDRLYRELVGHLLQFHRREAKPQYWAMFHRQELEEDDLVEDADCIGRLRHDPRNPAWLEKRSLVWTFTFPPQEYKLHVGDKPLIAHSLRPAGEIVALDEDALTVSLKIGKAAPPYEECFSIIPGRPVPYDALQEAIYRYADSVIARDGRYPAISAILTKAAPRVGDTAPGAPIIRGAVDPLAAAVSVICRLDDSYMLVQGPPGSGKTYTSSHAIVELLARGKRIGVSSNSHKAINNLLKVVEKEACRRGVLFCGAKKYNADDERFGGTLIEDVKTNEGMQAHHQLVGGTAWLFARPEFDQAFDYVFIDEAGQVSLANVVAIGVSTRNIVLVGDQMQLAQPLQGIHPGSSGCSALEYLLGDLATVPPERGIFLATTRRMHPDVCRFISEAVYDGRLEPEEENGRQGLLLAGDADPVLARSGIRFVPVVHEGCAQKSEAEAARIRNAYGSLLRQQWTDRKGVTRPITAADILVVSPYNVQVSHLKSVLPHGALVGTVDKFQGQEAPVVLISMATSSVDDIPRNLEFLFSRNRLNVAISRAFGLSVIFASPRLLEIPCSTIEQMRLVNTFCWAKAYAEDLPAPR